MTLARRSFITGLISLVAAPAIVRAGSLMPVRSMLVDDTGWGSRFGTMQDLIDAQRRYNLYCSQMIRWPAPVRWITRDEALEMFPNVAPAQ